MSWQYYVKALYAGVLAGLSSVSGALLAVPGTGLGDLSTGVYISAAVLGLAAFGGVLGWQAAPAAVSTSVR